MNHHPHALCTCSVASLITGQAGHFWKADPGQFSKAPKQFQLGSDGLIPTKPLKGWNIGHVGGVTLLLEAQYADTPEELETDQQHTLCLAISMPLALQLAEALKKYAQGFLNQAAPPGTLLH
jgi:hypothetical protein